MVYPGSKNRHARDILPIVLKDRKPDQYYVEPFVGGCNIIDKVDGWRIGSDIDVNIITLFIGLQQGFVPPDTVTEAEYQAAKTMQTSPLKSFIGFGCSYAGKWFGGYARGANNKGIERNYCAERKRNLMRQVPFIKDIEFVLSPYNALDIPPQSVVYCDPPYESTTKYKNELDHAAFWQWCKDMKHNGHVIFVSEYKAPSDFTCVWEKTVNSSLTQDTGAKKNVERLFTLI
jgi:DNA adenine methylase